MFQHLDSHLVFSGDIAASSADGLSALLTIEGLLLASLAIMASLSAPTLTGRPLPTKAHTAAAVVTAAISVIAVGAAAAVKRIFVEAPAEPDYWTAIPLLVGIVVQPLFAWWITKSLRGS